LNSVVGIVSSSPREKWASTARTALLFALPLAFVALLGAQWLDTDYVRSRELAHLETARLAETMAAAAANEVTELAGYALGNIDRAAGSGFAPPSQLWQVIYGYDLGLLILRRRGDRTIFPPDDPLAMPKMWEDKLRALINAADLLHEGDFVTGWFPNVSGEYYFECRRNGAEAEREEDCIALNSTQIFPTLFAALDDEASRFPGVSFRLRDPFERIVWRHGDAHDSFEAFAQGGTLRGWVVEIAGAPPPKRGALGRLALAAPLALVWLLLVYQARRAQNARVAEGVARAALATRLSHDLRTPLANLKLYAELISRKSQAVPDVARYCAVLAEEIDRLDALAGETIFLGGGAAPGPVLSLADPGALARKIAARYERLLASSGASCDVVSTVEGPLRFNTEAFERILVNLVDNARKYAPGPIEVTIGAHDGLLALSVRDYGVSAGAAPVTSHGLGLSIVQELARANGGGFALAGADPGLRARATLAAEPA
jgi:signal transduction histidine kinase